MSINFRGGFIRVRDVCVYPRTGSLHVSNGEEREAHEDRIADVPPGDPAHVFRHLDTAAV